MRAKTHHINPIYNPLVCRLRPLALVIAALLAATTAFAETFDPATYYSKANGKNKAALKTALHGIIASHTTISYDGLYDAYKESDNRPDGYVRDWYSNATKYRHVTDKAGTYSKEGDCYNREHSVPQSWFGGKSPMVSDLVHVLPTDGYVNNRRSNFPFGETNGDIYKSKNNYSKLGSCTTSGYSGTVFEPNDEIKGDLARIYFYMVTCYEDLITTWASGGISSQVFDGKTYPGLKAWTLNMMLRWSRNDPVDDVERARNEVVYKRQKNRNPYVDYPELCEYVWGNKTSELFYTANQPDNPDPDDPDPDNPDPDPDPDTPDPINPDVPVSSGTINFANVEWTAAQHPIYGAGFETQANGLTIGYYKNTSQNAPIIATGQVRIYSGSVFVISGANVKSVTMYGVSSYAYPLTINNTDYSFTNSSGNYILTWTGTADPFIAKANSKQVRITSIDVTVEDTTPSTPTVVDGDADGDGEVTLSDIGTIIQFIVSCQIPSFNFEAADTNHDQRITLADIVSIIGILIRQSTTK